MYRTGDLCARVSFASHPFACGRHWFLYGSRIDDRVLPGCGEISEVFHGLGMMPTCNDGTNVNSYGNADDDTEEASNQELVDKNFCHGEKQSFLIQWNEGCMAYLLSVSEKMEDTEQGRTIHQVQTDAHAGEKGSNAQLLVLPSTNGQENPDQ